MAGGFDDAEFFWLPSDEDFLTDRKGYVLGGQGGDGLAFGALGCGPGSGLSSPVDSLLGSLEAESDEEDLLADLTRKMASSSLEGGFTTSQVRLLSGSPQSTLCQGLDLLHEAAGEAARLRLREQLYGLSRGGEALHGAAGRHSSVPVPGKNRGSDGGFNNHSHHQHPLSYQQLIANQVQQLKQQQAMMKQKRQQQRPGAAWALNTKPNVGQYHAVQICGRKSDLANGGATGRPLVARAASAWPSMQQQQQNGAAMRAVFLGAGPTGKRERAGTGVFLPRRAGSHPEPRKRPACSTVLLPDKVVRALNLNVECVGSQPHFQCCINGGLASENDCVWNPGRNAPTAQQNRTSCSRPAPLNHEIRLPQEWTY